MLWDHDLVVHSRHLRLSRLCRKVRGVCLSVTSVKKCEGTCQPEPCWNFSLFSDVVQKACHGGDVVLPARLRRSLPKRNNHGLKEQACFSAMQLLVKWQAFDQLRMTNPENTPAKTATDSNEE